MSNPGFPINPIKSSPSKRENPIRINITVPIQKSIRFFIIMLPEFFALVKPASTMAKPACIQNTSAVPIKNHTPKMLLSTTSIISFVIIFPPHFHTFSVIYGQLKHMQICCYFPSVPPVNKKRHVPPSPQLCGSKKTHLLFYSL